MDTQKMCPWKRKTEVKLIINLPMFEDAFGKQEEIGGIWDRIN